MSIKTKEEMFGDGGGFGAAVPVSTANAPGTGAGNRGIDFGEQLTASIANRTHYALALNDEDLSARLVAFEAGGIDAAYRGGLVSTPGAGAVVTIDGQAIELQTALAADYAFDKFNAAIRVTTKNDTVEETVGYDFVGNIVDPDGTLNGGGNLGFIDRRNYGVRSIGGFGSNFTGTEAAVLNPSGAQPSVARMTTGGKKFSTNFAGPTPPAGVYSEIRRNYDLVEVIGGSNPGVYIASGFGSAETDIGLATMDGTAASFVADEAVTISVFRVKILSSSFRDGRFGLNSNVMQSAGDNTVLEIITGGQAEGGSQKGVGYFYSDGGGLLHSHAYIDQFGRKIVDFVSSDIPHYLGVGALESPEQAGGGAFASKVQRSRGGAGTAEFGHIVESLSNNNVQGRYDFASLLLMEETTLGFDSSIPFAFNANSILSGEVDMTSAALGAGWENYIVANLTLVEITSPAAQAGFYWARFADNAPAVIELSDLDGTFPPASFVNSGAGTLRVLSSSCIGRHLSSMQINSLAFTGPTKTMTPYNVFVGGGEDDAATLVTVTKPEVSGGGAAERAHIRSFRQDYGDGNPPQEVFSVEANGFIRAYSGLQAGAIFGSPSIVAYGDVEIDNAPAANFNFNPGHTRVVMLPFVNEMAAAGANWALGGATATDRWLDASSVNASTILDLNGWLPEGAIITDIRARLNIAAVGVGFDLELGYSTHDFTALAAPAFTSVATVANAATGYTTLSLASALGVGGHTVDKAVSAGVGRDYFIHVKSGDASDILLGLELTYTDPGPRNV